MTSDKFYKVVIGILILLVIWLAFRIEGMRKSSMEYDKAVKAQLIASDSMIKEAEGQFAKIVNYYAKEKDLNQELKESNKELYKLLKSQDEKILNLTRSVISLSSKIDNGVGQIDPLDTNKIDLTLKYPEEDNPFITWAGKVDRTSAMYSGLWTFGRLPIDIIVTEDSRGLWKHRISGPSWLTVDSMIVNSLPPEDYAQEKEKFIQFMVGGGYLSSLDKDRGPDVSVGGGISFNGNHNIIVNATTGRNVGFNYYYRFKALKKKNH